MNIRYYLLIVFIFVLHFCCIAQINKPYVLSEFKSQDFETMLEFCQRGGIEVLIQKKPFETYGHYNWNVDFAPEGEESVRQMVATAAMEGVDLGVWVQDNAVSVHDAFFSPEYYKQFRRGDQLELYSAITAEDNTIAMRRSDVLRQPASLNLLVIDDELISYSTLEFSGELALIHRCTRGAYGTKAAPHDVDAKAYRIWDSPDRFVEPEGELRDLVAQNLNQKLRFFQVKLFKNATPQEMIEENIRVSQVKRWEEEGSVSSLGWFMIRPSDKRRPGTTMEELEWMLSKAAGFDTGYGLLIDPKTITNHGMMAELLKTLNHWNRLMRQGRLTERQRTLLCDPYLDWHLVPQDSAHYLIYPQVVSRRFRCHFEESDYGVLRSETWTWNAEEGGAFGLRLQVDGTTEILNPMVNTSRGLVMFPCVIKPGQCLMYDFGDTARVVDAAFHVLEEVAIEGLAELDKGDNEVYFLCEANPVAKQRPEVTLRYIIREQPEIVTLENTPHQW